MRLGENGQQTPSNGNGHVVGRYSGKELRPEQLLKQVDEFERARIEGNNQAANSSSFSRSRRHGEGKRHSQQHTGAVQLPLAVQTQVQLFNDCVRVGDCLAASTSLQALVKECLQLHPAVWRLIFGGPDVQYRLHKFVRESTRRWLDDLRNGHAPLITPSGVISVVYPIMYDLPKHWTSRVFRAALSHVAESLCELRFLQSSSQNTNSDALVMGVGDLLHMWRLCISLQLTRNSSVGSHSKHEAHPGKLSFQKDNVGWGFLPSATALTAEHVHTGSRMTFSEMLSMLVPVGKTKNTSPSSREEDHYAGIALLTLDLLRSTENSEGVASATLHENAPFAEMLEAMLNQAPRPQLPQLMRTKLEDPTLSDHYRAMATRLGLEIDNLPVTRHTDSGEQAGDTSHAPEKPAAAPADSIEAGEESIGSDRQPAITPVDRFAQLNIQRLGRASERQDARHAEKILREVLAYARSAGSKPDLLPLELYECLMSTFLSLRNLKVAVGIWDHVVQSGYTPTARTYTIMMRGAQTSKDISGMEAFWQKMRKANVQPDVHAWSVRVYGLLRLKSTNQGLQALREMGQEWFAAARAAHTRELPSTQKKHVPPDNDLASRLLTKYPSDVDGVPRPNLAIMNSSIAALAQSNDQDVSKVLAWARSFGIEPDVYTYNALLNIMMRRGQADEGLNIIRRMQQRGVQANSTTWTVLLTALFESGFFDGVDPRQQQQKILNFINALESEDNGMPSLDNKGYALIIDRLLKHHGNSTAATAIINHMVERGCQPTAHIYTIIMASHFQQKPTPDFAAIQALWEQIESRDAGYGAKLDSVFYDRMIEGYAKHHNIVGIQPALDFLKRARHVGHKPGWGALQMTARMLAARADWNRLRALTDEVRAALRESHGGGWHHGQKDFWHFILETGILRDQGITRLDQVLPRDRQESPLLAAGSS